MGEEIKLNIGKKIKGLRVESKMTQKQVAKLLFVTDKAISKWETGKGYPDMMTIPLLSEIFNVSPSYFFSNSSNMENRVLEDETVEEVVSQTINYAKDVEKMKNQAFMNIITVSISVVFIISILICAFFDLVINKQITWSIIPAASIIFTWGLTIMWIFNKENKVFKLLLMFSIGILPFLWILERATKSSWLLQMGVPISIVVIGLIWMTYFLSRTSLTTEIIVAILLLFIPIIDLIVDLGMNLSIAEHYNNPWKIFTLLMSLAISLALIIVSHFYFKKFR